METVVAGSYVKNVAVPFITGSLLGLAVTNSAGLVLNSGGLSLTLQLITTVVPLFFWLIAMSLSHPWTSKMTARIRAAVHSMIATFIVLIWLTFISLMFIVSAGPSVGVPVASIVMAALLELLLLLSMIVASFVNAFITSKGVPSDKEEGFKNVKGNLEAAITMVDGETDVSDDVSDVVEEKPVKKPAAKSPAKKTPAKTAGKTTTVKKTPAAKTASKKA